MSDQKPQDQQNQLYDVSFWQTQHDAAAASSSQFLFPSKSERTRIKLLAHGPTPPECFREIESDFRGTKSKKYLIPCFEIIDPSDVSKAELRFLVATKGIWADITSLLAERHTLFNKESAAVIINKTTGARVSYSVMTSPPHVTVVAPDGLWEEAQNFDWDEVVAAHAKMQEGRGNGSDNANPANALADAIVNSAQPPQQDQGW